MATASFDEPSALHPSLARRSDSPGRGLDFVFSRGTPNVTARRMSPREHASHDPPPHDSDGRGVSVLVHGPNDIGKNGGVDAVDFALSGRITRLTCEATAAAP